VDGRGHCGRAHGGGIAGAGDELAVADGGVHGDDVLGVHQPGGAGPADGLLRLAAGRVTASEVLDLAATVPVARQFSFTGENLETLRRWTTKAGARWALFEAQRQRFGVPFRQNMFSTARDRLLLGITSDESDLAWLGVTLPLDDVDSTDVDLAGRFAEYIDRLGSSLARLADPHPARTWTTLLEQALDRLTDVGNIDAWQRTQASRELASATQHAGEVSLRLADVRAMLASRLAPRPTRANFRTGELTVATFVPMRSVPHRIVARSWGWTTTHSRAQPASTAMTSWPATRALVSETLAVKTGSCSSTPSCRPLSTLSSATRAPTPSAANGGPLRHHSPTSSTLSPPPSRMGSRS